MIRLPVPEEKKARPAKKRVDTPPMTKGNMQVRVVSFAIVVAVIFVVLAARLWYLQVLTGSDYSISAKATQTRVVKDPAQRGVIYDRDGEILANNEPGLNVTVIPDEIPREKVAELAGILEADKETVLASYDAAFELGNQYGPMLIKENADHDDITYVSERTEEFSGVTVNDDYIRNYPKGNVAAHILGYTGAITQQELKLAPFKDLSNDAVVGKSGVELYYEEVLRGKAGKQVYNVDALGRIVPEGSRVDSLGQFVDENGNPIEVDPSKEVPDRVVDPAPGRDLALTIDLDLQRVAEAELEAAIARAQSAGYAGSGGAAIAMDPRNGEILALASRPDFNPEIFVGGVSGAQEMGIYEYLISEASNDPFMNRAITGGQPAASTFKPFTGLAGLTFGVIDAYTTVTDTGECWRPTGSSWGCWQSWRENSPNYEYLGPHGTQNFAEAIKDSNDKFFYQVADWLWNATDDKDWLPHFYERFGFGHLTGVDLAAETAGRVPTHAGERELLIAMHGAAEEGHWTVGDWVNLSIGQGDLLVSPIQLARGYAAIYNGGTLVTPHVGGEIRQDGEVVKEISPEPAGQVNVNDYHLQLAMQGLREVTEDGGTAETIFKGSQLDVAGKSGTGEAPQGYINWFVGWAEGQERPMIVVVMIENGGAFQTGSEMTAGPAVRHILEAYYGIEQSPDDPHPTYTEPIPDSAAQ
ncbi:MAG TPA: penicillin-binding protein 2 [Rubrobacteraceae bacterium]|nr:penicillin-binding protein 2 [Rubrobacteraceae bacterium]